MCARAVSVESVSGFKEEIDGCFELFRHLQQIMLDTTVGPWGVRWYRVPLGSLARSGSADELLRLEEKLAEEHAKANPPPALPASARPAPLSDERLRDVFAGLIVGISVGALLALRLAPRLARPL